MSTMASLAHRSSALREETCEIFLPARGTWDYPLSHAEKIQRLVQLFESEVDKAEAEAEVLRHLVVRGGLAQGVAKTLESSTELPWPAEHVASVLKSLDGMRNQGSNGSHSPDAPDSPLSSAPSSSSPSPRRVPQRCQENPKSPSDQSQHPVRGTAPALPLLSLSRLNEAPVALAPTPKNIGTTPRDPLSSSTPRVYCIKTPPSGTPRVMSLTATPNSASKAKPSELARTGSLLTPRSEAATPRSEAGQQGIQASEEADAMAGRCGGDRDGSHGPDVRLNFMLTKAFQGAAADESDESSDDEGEDDLIGVKARNKDDVLKDVEHEEGQDEACDAWEVDHPIVFDNEQLVGLARLLLSVNEETRSTALADMSEENRWTMLRTMNGVAEGRRSASVDDDSPWASWAKDKAAGARLGLAQARDRVAMPAEWAAKTVPPKVSEYSAKAMDAAGNAAGNAADLAKHGLVAARTALWETRAQASQADAIPHRTPRESVREGAAKVVADVSHGVAVLRAHAEPVIAAYSPFKPHQGSRRRSRSCGAVPSRDQ